MLIIIRALAKKQQRRILRNIFSLTSVWDPKISATTRLQVEEFWKDKINRAPPKHVDPDKKMYVLSMFPYPSGQLHLGHVRVYAISDTYARFYAMHGKQVIHPMGWDSFGLPAENAAVERNENPRAWTEKNIESMKKQLKDLNFNFDWSRELSTCDPDYYKWTQYLFLKLYEKGLIYQKNAVVHWDPVDKTVLADEQVDAEGRSWRSGAVVEKKNLRQWFIRTTYLSKDLLAGLHDSERNDWDDVGPLQRGWIGECTGFSFEWSVIDSGGILHSDLLRVWTEQPEFLGAVTFVALSPDHSLALPIVNGPESTAEKRKYYALNPISGKKVPLLVSSKFEFPRATNCHLGTPSLSKEDLEFAVENGLEVIKVVDDHNPSHLINSGTLTGLSAKAARLQVCQQAQLEGRGGYPCSSHLKDWLISRQRYWGTPIPIVQCGVCGVVPVPYEELPVELPVLDKITKEGVSPLCGAHDWLNTSCPRCSGPATRETDTMDTFVDSSWYYLRFLDSNNSEKIVDPTVSRDLMPVDLYIGGLEHAVMHLYYARFVNHFCHGLGLTATKEPFLRMLVHGMVVNETFKLLGTGRYIPRDSVIEKGSKLFHKDTGEPVVVNWEKMSKSKHNGVRPEDVIMEHGIDTTRLFILCAYSPTSRYKWPSPAFRGIVSWQERLWLTVHDFRNSVGRSLEEAQSNPEFQDREASYYQGRNHHIKNVTFMYNVTRQLNLVIKDLQIFTKLLRYKNRGSVVFGREFERALAALLLMLAPLAPHFAAELWAGFTDAARFRDVDYQLDRPLMEQLWPQVDPDFSLDLLIKEDNVDLMRIQLPRHDFEHLTKESAYQMAIESESVRHRLQKGPKFRVVFDYYPSYRAELRFISRGKNAEEVQRVHFQSHIE